MPSDGSSIIEQAQQAAQRRLAETLQSQLEMLDARYAHNQTMMEQLEAVIVAKLLVRIGTA